MWHFPFYVEYPQIVQTHLVTWQERTNSKMRLANASVQKCWRTGSIRWLMALVRAGLRSEGCRAWLRQSCSSSAQLVQVLFPPFCSLRSTVKLSKAPNTMLFTQSIQGFFSTTPGGQKAFLILVVTSFSVSSMKMAELGSLLLIFSWPSCRPMSMWWLTMTGLFLILTSSQYSLASMLTLRWSMPSWQMSAFRKNTSEHYMQGYRLIATAMSSCSLRPIMVAQRFMRDTVFLRAMSMTVSQYSLGFLLISSLAHMKYTFSSFMPRAFQISMKYQPTTWILVRSPPILLLSMANQSATQKMKMHPALTRRLTLMALSTPQAMCILPLGSKPSQQIGCTFSLNSLSKSLSLMISSPTSFTSRFFSSTERLEGSGQKRALTSPIMESLPFLALFSYSLRADSRKEVTPVSTSILWKVMLPSMGSTLACIEQYLYIIIVVVILGASHHFLLSSFRSLDSMRVNFSLLTVSSDSLSLSFLLALGWSLSSLPSCWVSSSLLFAPIISQRIYSSVRSSPRSLTTLRRLSRVMQFLSPSTNRLNAFSISS